ncbi:CHAT domain-containing protein [Roseateles amylovorans]|uniref:CHAT domain-containing protein n=1 Tax=Roseateles amylovorans TaxID=2978473 RepID=A0ABY6AYC5_9BURK|nr:CHAT domain-containing protein [Roseateles amylovorans]UXH77918.1 CHAT domain-containing protein [Roseateles amylovorans]
MTTPQATQDVEDVRAAIAAAKLTRIYYFFPHAVQDMQRNSPLGWYSPGLLDAAGPFRLISAMPMDVREPHSSVTDVLVNRLGGITWPTLIPIQIDSFAAALDLLAAVFCVCVTTDPDVALVTDQIFAGRRTPVLHISSVGAPGRKPLAGVTAEVIAEYVRQVLDSLSARGEGKDFVKATRAMLTQAPRRKPKKHYLCVGHHNVTAPNELALAAFGYKFTRERAISRPIQELDGDPTKRYVTAICTSTDAILAERDQLLSAKVPGLVDHRLILAVASTYWGHFRQWRQLARSVDATDRHEFRRALASVIQAQTYFQQIQFDEDHEPVISRYQRMLSSMWATDLNALTAALGLMSSATLCPVVRLEPRLNQVRGDVIALAHCIRAQVGTHHAWKVARLTERLGAKARSLVNEEFLKRIDAPEKACIEGIKLVTDLPLELMPSNGIPIGLRFDTSRLSPFPGNLFWGTNMAPPVHLPVSAFHNVLIIRSFSDDDPIRCVLEQALETFAGGGFTHVKYRFVDVSTEAEFIETIQAFDGAVMIFDGHGRYDTDLGMGSLVVGGAPLDMWALKRKCQLPPVVMFSACDTQPIDGSHSSVATAALACGARAVLATMFPVNAKDSALMLARTLYRLDAFLPFAVKIFPMLTWRHVVSGMLRMSHTTESARSLDKRAHLGLTEGAFRRIQLVANNTINSWNPAWHRKWIEAIAAEAQRTPGEIEALLVKHVGLTESMRYVQLGIPERIYITP